MRATRLRPHPGQTRFCSNRSDLQRLQRSRHQVLFAVDLGECSHSSEREEERERGSPRPLLLAAQAFRGASATLRARARGGAAQAVGNLAAWRKGRTSQYTIQRTVHTVASISLPDLGHWVPGWDFPSQEALAHTSCNAAHSGHSGDWADQVTRVMLFIKSQTQQAVNAAATDSVRCWRQRAKEACQGSARAGHAFSKTGIDDGKHGGLAGPELLVKQMETWLPLWLDGRRAMQDIQEHRWIGTRLHQPQGYSADASRTASAIHRFAHGFRGQTPLLGTHDGFEAQAIRRSSHNRPHGCSVTCAIPFTQASGAKVGERARCGLLLGLPGQGVRPCCLCALDHGGGSKGAAAVGGFFVTGLGQILRTCRSRSSMAEGRKTSFPRRLWAYWCASYEGWRFLEADKLATFAFWAFWDHSSRLQWRDHSCQTYVGRGGQAVGGGPPGARSTALQGQIQSLHRWHGQAQEGSFAAVGGAWDRRVRHDTQRWGRSAAGQAAAGSRRQGAAGEGSEAHETRQAAAEGRGTHSQFDSHWLECWGALGFRGSGLHSNTAPSHQSRRGQSHLLAQPRTERSHNDDGPRPGSQGKEHRSSVPTHRQVVLALGDGSMRRHARPRHNAGGAPRDGGQAQPPQAPVVRRQRRGTHLRAHALAAGLGRAVGEAPHHPRWHEDRPLGGGAEDGGFLGGSGFPLVVRQLCTLESALLGCHQAATRLWHSGIGTFWSSWFREAFGPRSGSRGSGERTTTAASSATKAQAPCSTAVTSARPCRQSEARTSRRRCARRLVLWGHNTGPVCTLHISQPRCHSANRFSRAGMPCFVAQSAPDGLLEGHIFTDGSCGEQAGQWWWSTMWRTSKWLRLGLFRAMYCQGRHPAMARTTQRPWQSHHLAPARAAHRLRRYHRDRQWAKVQSLGRWGSPSTRLEQASGFPRRGQGSHGQGPFDRARRGGWAHFPSCLFFYKKEPTHASLPFESPRQSLPLLSWPSKWGAMGGRGPRLAQVQGSERHQGCRAKSEDTASAGEDQAQAQGERGTGFRSGVRLALSHRSHTHFSQDSHLDPRTFRGTACSWDEFSILGVGRWTVPSSSAPNVERYWERADALCRSCSEFPSGRTSQVRKLRSGLFPNKRCPGWTVEHVRRPTLDEGNYFGGATGILRGGSGPNRHGAHHTQVATCCPAGSGAGTLGAQCRGATTEDLALQRWDHCRPGVVGGVWAQRSAGAKACLQG